MITRLNLSTHPFRNRTTPYLISLLLLALTLVGALYCIARLRDNRKVNDIAAAQIKQMEDEVARLKGEGAKVQQQLSPEHRELLVASHKLVASKSFGWSRLFADLESVLPPGVSASRISVENVFKDGDRVKAELELGVLSRNYEAVMSMIAAMNASGLFRAELRGQDLQKNERITYSEYTLRLIYMPGYGYAPATDVAQGPGGEQ